METINDNVYFNDWKSEEKVNDLVKHERVMEIEQEMSDITKYTAFNIGDIGFVLEGLFTVYMGCEYQFTMVPSYDFLVGINCYFLDNGEEKIDLARLYWKNEQKIQFYKSAKDFTSNKLLVSYHPILECYPFVKNFINYVVKHRISKDLKEIDASTLRILLRKFIVLHKEEIEIIHNKFYKQDLKGIKEKKKEREQSLLKVINYED